MGLRMTSAAVCWSVAGRAAATIKPQFEVAEISGTYRIVWNGLARGWNPRTVSRAAGATSVQHLYAQCPVGLSIARSRKPPRFPRESANFHSSGIGSTSVGYSCHRERLGPRVERPARLGFTRETRPSSAARKDRHGFPGPEAGEALEDRTRAGIVNPGRRAGAMERGENSASAAGIASGMALSNEGCR